MSKVEIPETHYARNGSINLAYQTIGHGPIDVVFLSGGLSHLDYSWQLPPVVRFIERFSSFSRLVIYDPRGCGLSDRSTEPATIAEGVSDAIAILDELGIERANLFGQFDGGSTFLALAAAHPDRVNKVAVDGAVCRFAGLEDLLVPFDRRDAEATAAGMESIWGGTGLLELVAPNHADDPVLARWFTSVNRAAVSPAGAAAWYRHLGEIDIRPVLSEVAAPVLVTNRADTRAVDRSQALYLAEHLPDARHVEFPGEDYFLWVGDTDAVLDEVEEFFTGKRPSRTPTRALATVMFTDIVGSTQQAADLDE